MRLAVVDIGGQQIERKPAIRVLVHVLQRLLDVASPLTLAFGKSNVEDPAREAVIRARRQCAAVNPFEVGVALLRLIEHQGADVEATEARDWQSPLLQETKERSVPAPEVIHGE